MDIKHVFEDPRIVMPEEDIYVREFNLEVHVEFDDNVKY